MKLNSVDSSTAAEESTNAVVVDEAMKQAQLTTPPRAARPLENDESRVLTQLLGLNFRKRDIYEKEDQQTDLFCPSWSSQVRAAYRECIDKIKVSLQKTSPQSQNIPILEEHLVETFEPSQAFHFMEHLDTQRYSILVDLCGMIGMEIKLKACLKAGFASLSSVPSNISSESKSYLQSILRKLT